VQVIHVPSSSFIHGGPSQVCRSYSIGLRLFSPEVSTILEVLMISLKLA
jgi:hypothetical protein